MPSEQADVRFSIGQMTYGSIEIWSMVRLILHFDPPGQGPTSCPLETVKWQGKQVIQYFFKELFTTYQKETRAGLHSIQMVFKFPRPLEVSGQICSVSGITCEAIRVNERKKKWSSWSGEGLIDWQTLDSTTGRVNVSVPNGAALTGSWLATDLSQWESHDGDLPQISATDQYGNIILIMYNRNTWDSLNDHLVPDLSLL
jgi:hypothetical protein